MTQKQKGLIGLAVMIVLALVAIFASDSIYQMINNSGKASLSFNAGTYTGTAQGYGGDVIAVVTVSDKKIESVELKGDGETPTIGGAALEQLGASFVENQSSQVDLVSGATITSEAAVKAVEMALAQADGSASVVVAEETKEAGNEAETEAPVETEAETEGETETQGEPDYFYLEGTYTVDAEGYGGPVMAEVEIDAEGNIVSVILTGDKETPAIGGAALEKLEKAFVEKQSENVDAIAGATITSEAAIEAVQIALEEAKEYFDEGENLSELLLAAGTFTGSYKGYGGDVVAEIVISDEGVIETVTLTGDEETPEIGGEAMKTLEQAFIDKQSSEVDIVSGATKTCDAAIEAVEQAIINAEEAYEEQ